MQTTDNKILKEKVDKIVKDILKPECDEELSEDEYPKLKDDD